MPGNQSALLTEITDIKHNYSTYSRLIILQSKLSVTAMGK